MGGFKMSQSNAAPTTIFEAKITELSSALNSGHTTAVDLVAKYLLRIATFDTRQTALNSIPLINLDVFDEAAQSDDHRQSDKSRRRPLEGIPFTAKDSYKVKDMAVASGSDAFENLIANEDAFTVSILRQAGAVFLGKTNMCPMAFGGMQRGVYGRSESPYNLEFLPAAFASGSSNGSGVSTAASFAAFGMGEETVSSGRSPASNNGIVAYTPSRGLISIRGNWPLYPTCDVVVPHARTMDDLFRVLEVVTIEDENTTGDFWRDQPFLKIPKSFHNRPRQFSDLTEKDFLRGKRIAIPDMYVGAEGNPAAVYTSNAVKRLWYQAKADLEACGAVVESCSQFPAVTMYEDPSSSRWPAGLERLPEDWNSTERGALIAHAWDNFLRTNSDAKIPSIASVDSSKLFPQLPADHPQVRFSEVANAVHWSKLASYVEGQTGKTYNIPKLEQATKTLEHMRKVLFEDWLTENNFDFVVFPAAGDVGSAFADVDVELAEHAWRNGVKYSNGNRALRHLGIPSVTVPMGQIPEKRMPVGLTFLGRAYEDDSILKAGYAFEQSRQRRESPALTPELSSDALFQDHILNSTTERPEIKLTKCCILHVADDQSMRLEIEGTLSFRHLISEPQVDMYVDGIKVSGPKIQPRQEQTGIANGDNPALIYFHGSWTIDAPPEPDQRNRVRGKIARDSTMVIVLARDGKGGRPSGCLKLIHRDDVSRSS